MTFVQRLLVLFYVTLVAFLGCFFLLLAFNLYAQQVLGINLIDINWVYFILYSVIHDYKLSMAFSIIAAFFLVVNFIFFSVYSVNVHRDKTIAFDNPTGRVSVSLFAIEDLIKRAVVKFPVVRDSKPTVTMSKKGLYIRLKLSLSADVNIPDVTSEIQRFVVKKIQDTIGLNEPIIVTVYVGKIVSGVNQDKQADAKLEPNVPFQGYRA
jgi:uncharacterized alkaline shock family protein YloU